jgi:PAS domain S-box-containing protein
MFLFISMAVFAVILLVLVGKYFLQNLEKGKRSIELNRISRLNAFSNQVNHNIVRSEDEDMLFRNACNIAIEFGKFKMAWIGIFDKESQTISSVNQKGIPDEDVIHFKNIPLVPDGPQEYVFNRGNFFFCNDIHTDTGLPNWRPLVEKYGIGSFMILPVKKSGYVIGTFNLYATELNFFKKEEIELLDELTNDISFALDMFEKENAYKQTQQLVIQNEKRFRALIEKSADIVTLCTATGKFLYGSNSIKQVLGYTVEELLQLSAFDIIHPDDTPIGIENRDKLLDTPGESFYYQQRRKHKNGSWIWCEGTLTNMLHEPGINALVSNFRDISQKKIIAEQQDFDKNNLNALINNTNDLMWSVDTDFNLITSNKPYNKFVTGLYGRAINKAESVLVVSLDGDRLERNKSFYSRAFSGETFTEVVHNALPVEVWSEISYYPIRKGDVVIGTACHSRNITENVKAAQQIAANEKRFRALVENGTDAVAILSETGGVNYISSSIERILGYTEDEALKMNKFSIVHPDDLECAKKVWEQMLASYGVPVSGVSCRMRHKDGSWRWLEATITNLLNDPDVNGIVDNFRDVTEKKLADEGLLLTQLALDNAGDAVFWMTPDAQIVRVNQAACTMLGYERGEMIKLTIPDIDPYYDMEKWPVHFDHLRQAGSIFFETIQKAKDGRLIPVEIRANYIKFDKAEFNCAFVRDISERKQAEAERTQMVNDLMLRNVELEQFGYIISHNLRAPVANIIGASSALNDPELDDEDKEILNRGINQSVIKLDNVVKDLNHILQVKGEINDTKEMIHFSELVDDIKTSINYQVEKEDIEIKYNFKEVDEFFTLKPYMYSVFYNLISNSIKYRRPHISTLIKIKSRLRKNKLELLFEDNGLGIDLKKNGGDVFGLYKRFHTNIEGKGMGLFMVKTQVETLGGKISIKSTENESTEFKLEFEI